MNDSWGVAKAKWYSARARLDTFKHVPGDWPGVGGLAVRGEAGRMGLHLPRQGGPHKVRERRNKMCRTVLNV